MSSEQVKHDPRGVGAFRQTPEGQELLDLARAMYESEGGGVIEVPVVPVGRPRWKRWLGYGIAVAVGCSIAYGVVLLANWLTDGMEPVKQEEAPAPKRVEVTAEAAARAKRLVERGDAALREKQVSEALRLYAKAGELHPRMQPAFEQHCYASLLAKHLDDALVSCQEAVRQSPGRSRVLMLLGYANQADGRDRDAIEAFNRVLNGQPDFAAAHFARGVSRLKLGGYQAALEDLKTAAAYRPGFGQGHYFLGLALYAVENYQESLKACGRALKYGFDVGAVYELRGCSQWRLGARQAAWADMERARRLDWDFKGEDGVSAARLIGGAGVVGLPGVE